MAYVYFLANWSNRAMIYFLNCLIVFGVIASHESTDRASRYALNRFVLLLSKTSLFKRPFLSPKNFDILSAIFGNPINLVFDISLLFIRCSKFVTLKYLFRKRKLATFAFGR